MSLNIVQILNIHSTVLKLNNSTQTKSKIKLAKAAPAKVDAKKVPAKQEPAKKVIEKTNAKQVADTKKAAIKKKA